MMTGLDIALTVISVGLLVIVITNASKAAKAACQRFVLLQIRSELEHITFLLLQEEKASRILEDMKRIHQDQETPK